MEGSIVWIRGANGRPELSLTGYSLAGGLMVDDLIDEQDRVGCPARGSI